MSHSSTWSPLSDVTVDLNPSKDYQKLLLMLYLMVLYAMFNINCDVGVSCFLIGVMSLYFTYLWGLNECETLHIHEKAKMRYDLGWCFVVQLTGKAPKLIFQDQLMLKEARLLRLKFLVQ